MKNKVTITIVGLFGILLVVAGSFIFVKWMFFGKYIKEVVLERNFLISSEWKEIETKNLIKIDKDKHYIEILLEPPFEADTPKGGIKSPSGEIINPEIKLIDEDGKEYLLSYAGSRSYKSNQYANYRCKEDFPVIKKYEKVLIRSDLPIKAKEINWAGYNIKDLK